MTEESRFDDHWQAVSKPGGSSAVVRAVAFEVRTAVRDRLSRSVAFRETIDGFLTFLLLQLLLLMLLFLECKSGGATNLLAMWRPQQLVRSSVALARAAVWASEQPGVTRAVRSFAAKAEAEQNVEVPLPMYGVAGKYASALYVTAVRANVLDPVGSELQQVVGAAERNSVFSDFMKDPSVAKTVRMKAVEEIFKQTKFCDVTKNFLAVLAENGRLGQLPWIYGCYSELLHAHRGEVQALVTAALVLSPGELQDINNALQGHLKPGQTLKVDQKVDRSIIGGILVDIQDKHIDLSIQTKIKQMEKLLAEPI